MVGNGSNYELEKMLKEVVVAYFNVIAVAGRTKEDQERSTWTVVSRLRVQPGTTRI
jgi:hypothetical protein